MNHLLSQAFRAMRANLVPGLILQAFAVAIVIAYFTIPSAAELLDQLGRLKQRQGFYFSACSTAAFGGLIPFLILRASGKIPTHRAGRELLFYVSFWFCKGVEVDAFYRTQAWLFGDDATWTTILSKTVVDQFVYNPLWAAPTQTLFFLWKDRDFSWIGVRSALAEQSAFRRTLLVLFSTWAVWIPAVAIVYALPSPLQVPLFNLVLCFWCLLLSFLTAPPQPTNDDAPSSRRPGSAP